MTPTPGSDDDDLLAKEAEDAKSAGEHSVDNDLPSIEFYYGKVKQHGRWVKTGKIYWIYTAYQDGKRKRISPTKIYRREKGITSIEKCPYEGRVLEFYRRSLAVGTAGDTDHDGGLQGAQGRDPDRLAGDR